MEELYYNLVINHKRTCDESNTGSTLVPATVRGKVSELLEARGYDKNGDRII